MRSKVRSMGRSLRAGVANYNSGNADGVYRRDRGSPRQVGKNSRPQSRGRRHVRKAAVARQVGTGLASLGSDPVVIQILRKPSALICHFPSGFDA